MSNPELPPDPGASRVPSPVERLSQKLEGGVTGRPARTIEYTGSHEQAVATVKSLLHPDANPASARWQDTFIESSKQTLANVSRKEWPTFEKRLFRELDIAADARGSTLPGKVKGKDTGTVER